LGIGRLGCLRPSKLLVRRPALAPPLPTKSRHALFTECYAAAAVLSLKPLGALADRKVLLPHHPRQRHSPGATVHQPPRRPRGLTSFFFLSPLTTAAAPNQPHAPNSENQNLMEPMDPFPSTNGLAPRRPFGGMQRLIAHRRPKSLPSRQWPHPRNVNPAPLSWPGKAAKGLFFWMGRVFFFCFSHAHPRNPGPARVNIFFLAVRVVKT